MVRLTAPLSRNSVGLVRPTHGSCGLLKTEHTAGFNEWPPDRRDIDKNASPHPQSLLRQSISAVTSTATLELRQENVNPTAPLEKSQLHRASHESKDNHKGRTRQLIEDQTQKVPPLPAPQERRAHEHSPLHDNRHKNKPHPGPLSQSEREQVLVDCSHVECSPLRSVETARRTRSIHHHVRRVSQRPTLCHDFCKYAVLSRSHLAGCRAPFALRLA